ncbi:MAG: hypothetical protein HY672_03135 [Chloroflexi bacterium]|nr:hypothetical protein [Chloroflexota bacterium]
MVSARGKAKTLVTRREGRRITEDGVVTNISDCPVGVVVQRTSDGAMFRLDSQRYFNADREEKPGYATVISLEDGSRFGVPYNILVTCFPPELADHYRSESQNPETPEPSPPVRLRRQRLLQGWSSPTYDRKRLKYSSTGPLLITLGRLGEADTQSLAKALPGLTMGQIQGVLGRALQRGLVLRRPVQMIPEGRRYFYSLTEMGRQVAGWWERSIAKGGSDEQR